MHRDQYRKQQTIFMIDILQRLEFTVDVQADGSWDVSAPLYREDVESFPAAIGLYLSLIHI